MFDEMAAEMALSPPRSGFFPDFIDGMHASHGRSNFTTTDAA